jgi:polyglutamine-binding protein 1
MMRYACHSFSFSATFSQGSTWRINSLDQFQGPLFQQRPYPSPGAVLRKNAEIASKKKKPNSNFTAISKRGDGSDGLGDAD